MKTYKYLLEIEVEDDCPDFERELLRADIEDVLCDVDFLQDFKLTHTE